MTPQPPWPSRAGAAQLPEGRLQLPQLEHHVVHRVPLEVLLAIELERLRVLECLTVELDGAKLMLVAHVLACPQLLAQLVSGQEAVVSVRLAQKDDLAIGRLAQLRTQLVDLRQHLGKLEAAIVRRNVAPADDHEQHVGPGDVVTQIREGVQVLRTPSRKRSEAAAAKGSRVGDS